MQKRQSKVQLKYIPKQIIISAYEIVAMNLLHIELISFHKFKFVEV